VPRTDERSARPERAPCVADASGAPPRVASDEPAELIAELAKRPDDVALLRVFAEWLSRRWSGARSSWHIAVGSAGSST